MRATIAISTHATVLIEYLYDDDSAEKSDDECANGALISNNFSSKDDGTATFVCNHVDGLLLNCWIIIQPSIDTEG